LGGFSDRVVDRAFGTLAPAVSAGGADADEGCATSEDVEPSRTVTPTPATKIRVSERGSSTGRPV